jgi:hypothetical protein
MKNQLLISILIMILLWSCSGSQKKNSLNDDQTNGKHNEEKSTSINSNPKEDNEQNSYLGTYVYAEGESDFYRTYKIVVSKNGEDFLLTRYNGRDRNGQYKKDRVVGKLNGTSIEINRFVKYSFIEDGTILIYNGADDSNGREFIKQK